MALDAGYAKSLLYFAETKNERVFELVEKAKDKGIAAQPVDVFRLDQLSGAVSYTHPTLPTKRIV